MQRILIAFLYRLLQLAAFPLLLVYLVARGVRDRHYFSQLWERFGFLAPAFRATAPGAIWLHAVSVGEVTAGIHLLERLRKEYPFRRIFVSATTLAGRALADEKLKSLVDGVFYAPIDYCFAVRSVLRTLRPSVVVILETEIWPNWFREIKRSGAGLIVANARISDRAMPRYRRLAWFFRHVLAEPDMVLVQSEQAAERFRELGAPVSKIRNAGNLKYDFDPSALPPPAAITRLIEKSEPQEIWIAASTMPPARPGDVDEDDAVIAAFQELLQIRERLLLILVPRRPVRFDEAARKLREAGIAFLRRSELRGEDRLSLPAALLLDTIGELSSLFPVATAVFMGGTLAERGGHNILEPAAFGKPIVIGPHMENFPAIAHEFRTHGGVVEIASTNELAPATSELLLDPKRRESLGGRARNLAAAQRGATEKVMAEIRRWSDSSVTRPIHPLAVRALLAPFTWMWAAGVSWRRARAMQVRKSLATPVVSVGGIGMGGAGKTPFTLHVASRLKERGHEPAILSRGYRRRVPEKWTILEAGATARPSRTGDEAQLFLRAGVAHIGIGADRHATGRRLEERLHPSVILLDDGFQHWKLARDLDVVLVDALDPFAGHALFPLGRQRERLEELARADAFVISRTEPGSPLTGIADQLHEYNSRAPVFVSRVCPEAWVDVTSGETMQPGFVRGHCHGAFCALANPSSFWRTLASLGCRPMHRWTFGDHHHYGPQELKRMAAEARAGGAEALLTTEKDLMNLPAYAGRLVEPTRLLWLRIGMSIEREGELLRLIEDRVRAKAARAPASVPEKILRDGEASL